jgi:hypothetical protein
VGGLVATVAMTAVMLALGDDSPPPTAALWAKFVGDEGPEAYRPQGMALHFLYGVGAAVAFVALLNVGLGLGTGEAVSMTIGLAAAVAYALVLTVVGAVVWMRAVLGMDPDRGTAALFALFHVVYGVVLGAFVVFGPV